MKVTVTLREAGRKINFDGVLAVVTDDAHYLEVRTKTGSLMIPHQEVASIVKNVPDVQVYHVGGLVSTPPGEAAARRMAEQLAAAGPVHGAITPKGFRRPPAGQEELAAHMSRELEKTMRDVVHNLKRPAR